MPYLTPDTIPGDTICRTLRIPNNLDWKMIVNGGVSELIYKWNFEQFGLLTPDEVAARFEIMFDEYLISDCGDCMGCCHETVLHRVGEGGGLEINIDGGGWIPDPSDPRATATLYPPIVFDSHHTKCDAAINASVHIAHIVAETSDQLGGTGSIIEIAAAIVIGIFALFIAPETLPELAPVILPLIAGLLFLGQAAWDAYFTADTDSKILCALFCTIGEDGTFTDAQYAAFLARLAADLPASPAKDYFIQIVSRIGTVGINDYAAIGTSADGDCTDCPCTDSCDLTNWAVLENTPNYFGIVVSRDETTGDIVVSTDVINTDGGYYIIIKTPAADTCCSLKAVEVTSGEVTGGRARINCGTAFDFEAFNYGLDPLDQCLNALLYKSSVPFTVKFTFESCP